jgi:hypothetical protein
MILFTLWGAPTRHNKATHHKATRDMRILPKRKVEMYVTYYFQNGVTETACSF